MTHAYSTLSVMGHLLQRTVIYDTVLQHTVSNDMSVTAYCQL